MFETIAKAHELLHASVLQQNPSYIPLGPNENYSSWTPNNNAWAPSSTSSSGTWAADHAANAGDNWTGANNPFGPKVPLGAHGAYGQAPAGAGGWASGECNFNGQAQCGQGPAPMVTPGHGWGVKPPPASGLGSGVLPANYSGYGNPYSG